MPIVPSEQDMKTLKWLLERLRISEDFCRPYFERAKRHYRLYRFGTAVDQKDWPYVNMVKTRDIFAFVEDATATMVQTLFGTTPFYSVIPRHTSQMMLQYTGIDPTKVARQLETFLDNQISHENAEFFEEITDYFKEGGIYGTSYIGVYPRFEDNNVYAGPIFKTIGFWDVLPIWGARRMTKARGVFVREFVSKDEAVDLATKWGKPDAVAQMKGWNEGVERMWHKDLLNELGITQWQPEIEEIEVFHYFSGGHVISMADRAIIIRNSNVPVKNQLGQEQVVKPFPYDQPIVQYKFIPFPQEWFGCGIPEVLEVLQEDRNLVRSARRDNIDLCINKVIMARQGADINYDLIKYYPAAIWPLENMNDIAPWEIGDVTQSSYMEEDKISHDQENALSMFGYARGMTPAHEERPTTVMKLQQASLNRLDLAIKLAEFGVLQNIAIRTILLARRFMKQEQYQSIIGDVDAGFYKMSEDSIAKFLMFKPMGSSVTHVKELRQQQLAMASQIIEKLAPVAMSGPQPFMIDWYEAGVSSLESLDIKNIDQILVKLEPPQAQQMMQQSEMKQLQQVKYGEEITQGTKAKYEAMLQDNQAKNDIILEKVKADVAPRPQKASKK